MDNPLYVLLGIGAPIAAAIFAFILIGSINRRDAGSERMQQISALIRSGAMAFLRTEYSVLAVFVALMFGVLVAFLPGNSLLVGVSFLVGASLSATAGWVGMRTATGAAVRTTAAAQKSLAGALQVAFSSGAVMGLTVVALGTLGIALLYYLYGGLAGQGASAVESLLGMSFGASSIALFARVGGGIFTKAADVAGDLSGKVEAGIPEDDPRNPATIADNVGDNVGDVAGMGADLFESFVGAMLATVILGYALGTEAAESTATGLMMYPLALGATGILASVIGTFSVKTDDESKLGHALHSGLLKASFWLTGFMAILTFAIDPHYTSGTGDAAVTYGAWSIFLAMVIGLFLGVAIGQVTEYYTSERKRPVHAIAEQSETGAATNIIAGLATGMMSTAVPVLLLAIGIYFCNSLAGIYGICIAAAGMLATLGISLGVDAFGPVADNAGGLAEMAHCDPEVRKRTDALDATGNTTAAIGKGFAIGSAALTALALFNTFAIKAGDIQMSLNQADVTVGILIGAMLPFLFSALAMSAVGKAAKAMVDEVRRQFKEIPGIMEGTAEPDYRSCVDISTKGALNQMVAPGILAVASPIVVGMFFGTAAVGGMLAGALGAGVLMALFMANAGGAWDNAKKYIEAGNHGGKGSDPHKAAVIGDTVGDPFKDTAGPSINILIKLMSIASVLALPLFK